MANIGLTFVNPAPLTKPEYVLNFAKKCEAMGLQSIWTIDRIVYDNLEPLTLLAALAGVTQKIRIGTSVLLPGLRHPALLAKIVGDTRFHFKRAGHDRRRFWQPRKRFHRGRGSFRGKR